MRRTGKQVSPLDRLPKRRFRALKAWMEDDFTYREIQRRLLAQGIRTSIRALCAFYYRHVAKVETTASPLLDFIVTQTPRGLRVQVYQKQAGIEASYLEPKGLKRIEQESPGDT